MNPGTRVTSPRSSTLAPAGRVTLDAGPTAVMRSSVTTMTALEIGAAPVPSISRAPRSTVTCWAKTGVTTERSSSADTMNDDVRRMLVLP